MGEDRSITHDMPGTTRDAIDTRVETADGPIVFVDTAGMRKKSKVDESAEYYSFVRALRAVDESDVALLVIDSTEGVTSQDQRLAERIDAAGCPLIVVLNKWDLLNDDDKVKWTLTSLASSTSSVIHRSCGCRHSRGRGCTASSRCWWTRSTTITSACRPAT
ncbi:MAG: GTP-binding protein [Actinobacteria bacterium]|nr:GTP-binding protein [Actinomycetota bacterium]